MFTDEIEDLRFFAQRVDENLSCEMKNIRALEKSKSDTDAQITNVNLALNKLSVILNDLRDNHDKMEERSDSLVRSTNRALDIHVNRMLAIEKRLDDIECRYRGLKTYCESSATRIKENFHVCEEYAKRLQTIEDKLLVSSANEANQWNEIRELQKQQCYRSSGRFHRAMCYDISDVCIQETPQFICDKILLNSTGLDYVAKASIERIHGRSTLNLHIYTKNEQ